MQHLWRPKKATAIYSNRAHAAHTLEYRRHPCFLDSVCNTFDDQKKQLPSILTEHMQVSKEVRVRRPTVVRQRLDFFSPLLSSLFPSKNMSTQLKLKVVLYFLLILIANLILLIALYLFWIIFFQFHHLAFCCILYLYQIWSSFFLFFKDLFLNFIPYYLI
jgi:hypothetical protein